MGFEVIKAEEMLAAALSTSSGRSYSTRCHPGMRWQSSSVGTVLRSTG